MMRNRYTFADSYILEELQARYRSADRGGRIRLLSEVYADENHQPPYEVASLAATDPDVEIRRWIARNGRFLDYRERDAEQNSPTRNLAERLKQDDDPLVRAPLLGNPDILSGLSGPDKSERWFNDSSHLERLALVRNSAIHEDFIVKLFDPADQELGIDLTQRLELCCAFLLSNRSVLDKNAKDGGFEDPLGFGRLEWLGVGYEARKFLNSIRKNAAKWPNGTGNIQSGVYAWVRA
jgi:hypothetical protein